MTPPRERHELESRIKELERQLAAKDGELSELRSEQAQILTSADNRGCSESQRLLAKVQQLSNIGIWQLDLISNRLGWSESIYRMFGLNVDEFEATYEAFLERVHPEDRAAVDAAFQDSLRQGSQGYEIQHRILRKDTGETRHVFEKCEHLRDASGQVVRSEGIVHDMTERIRTEAALRENQKKFQTIVDQTVDMLLVHDLDGRILDVNQRAVEQYGYTRQELLSLNVADLDPEYHVREQNGLFWELVDINQPHSFEARQQRKDGSVFPVEVTVSKIWLNGGVRVMGLCRDITERKHYELALIHAKDQAEKASKAKSSFLAKMSHEIRTPLNTILGMQRLVLMGELPQKQRDRLQVAKESADSLLWLLNDLLDLSRIEAGRFALQEKEFRLRRLLNGIVQEMELPASEKGLDLSLRMEDRLASMNLIGDQHRLKQILINLLSNAVKFTEAGWVCLEARLMEPDDRPGGDSADEVTVLFQVSDSGPGIDPAELKTIFETYEQGQHGNASTWGGAGLGLAICQKLSQQMGGNVWAESHFRAGSTFSVSVPFKANPLDVPETSAETESWPALRPLRILLVEDQKMNQLFTVDLLSCQHHEVEVAENGSQALEMLTRTSYDLVLMDIKMPVMDGLEAATQIRTADHRIMNPDIPIIGLSAHAATDDEMARFQNAGFDEYIVKPVQFDKLFEAMKAAMESRQMLEMIR